jgi:hypothetical protein
MRAMILAMAGAVALAAGPRAVAPKSYACTLRIWRQDDGGPTATVDFRGSFAGGAGRFDIVGGSDSTNYPVGAYVLVADTTGAAWLVLPAEKAYSRMPTGVSLGGIVDPYLPPGSIAGAAVTVDNLGPGEIIDGYSTLHYRFTSVFNLKVLSDGHEETGRNRAVTDVWQIDLPATIPDPFLGLGGNRSDSNRFKSLDDKLSVAYPRLSGVTIRSTTTDDFSAAGVILAHTKVTTQLSNIREATVDKAILAIPPGYTLRRK